MTRGIGGFGGELRLEYWGQPSKALYTLWTVFGDFSKALDILPLRSFYLLTPWVFLALVAKLGSYAPNDAAGKIDGVGTPLSSQWQLILVTLATFNFVLCFGILDAIYLAPMPVVFGVALLASSEEENRGDFWSLTALTSSLVMLVLFRPESPLIGIVIVALLIWRLGRKRRVAMIALVATLLVIFLLSFSAVSDLLISLRTDTFVFAEDTSSDRTVFGAIPMLLKRLALGFPVAFLSQVFWTAGLFGLAVFGVVRLVRKRGGDAPTLLAAGWLSLELLVLSVHQDGPAIQILKYGLVFITPAWFLASAELVRRHHSRRWRGAFKLSFIVLSLTFLPTLALKIWAGEDVAERVRIESEIVHTVADLACPPDGGHERALMVLGINDEPFQFSDSEGFIVNLQRFVTFLGKKIAEPDVEMVEELIMRNGCDAVNYCPSGSDLTLTEGSLDLSLELRSLCGWSCTERDEPPDPMAERLHTAVVHAEDTNRLGEVELSLDGPDSCGWRVAQRFPHMLLLRR